MKIIDANIVLRYLLEDHQELSAKANEIITNNQVVLMIEVVAEVVYVLSGVYNVPREEIAEVIIEFGTLDNITFKNKLITINALQNFSNCNLDFIDCVLLSYNMLRNYEIFSFDKKLMKQIEMNN
jgi:predicted nucleic-acid-binding protein